MNITPTKLAAPATPRHPAVTTHRPEATRAFEWARRGAGPALSRRQGRATKRPAATPTAAGWTTAPPYPAVSSRPAPASPRRGPVIPAETTGLWLKLCVAMAVCTLAASLEMAVLLRADQLQPLDHHVADMFAAILFLSWAAGTLLLPRRARTPSRKATT